MTKEQLSKARDILLNQEDVNKLWDLMAEVEQEAFARGYDKAVSWLRPLTKDFTS